ncbi:MAG: beta strand repeat-containing protein, partial [Fidelibacterota bacterium]
MNKFLLFFLLCTNFVFGQKNRSLTPSALQGVEASEAIEAVTTSVPRTLSYQGLLTQPNGRAIKDGTLQVTFRLFTDLEGGSFFWEESQDVFIEDGILTATLGKLVAIESVPSSSFLEVDVNGTTLSPRQEMTSSFYAVISDTAKFSQGGNYADLDGLPDLSIFAPKDTLSSYPLSDSLNSVAFTGEYSDLANIPDLSGVTQSDTLNYYVMSDSLSSYTLTSSLSAVASSNNYDDLNNLPDLSIYANIETLNNYATKDTLSNYVTVDTLSSYALNDSLGSLSEQNSDEVIITGGSISGIDDIAIGDGGTGASDIASARQNLGLEIGVDIQGYDSDVADLADGTLSAIKVQYLENVTSDIQTQLDDIGDGPVSSLVDLGVNADATEINYIDGVTSNVQTQLDGKQSLNADLTALTNLNQNDGNFIVSDGTDWTVESGADARVSLGLEDMASQISNNVSITGGRITNIIDITIGDGGTGASDITTARSNLGLELGVDVQVYDADLTDLADGTLSASKVEYLTSVTSDVQSQLDSKGTGTVSSLVDLGVTAEDIELNYVDGVTSNVQTQLNAKQDINSTLTDILGLSPNDGDLLISDGSSWTLENGSTARASLGLGSMAIQGTDDVTITGGSISGVADIAVSDGGTGASDISTARSNLGLVIGTDIQAYDTDLADLADGKLSSSKVESGEFFINTAGTIGDVWISDGVNEGYWGTASAISGAASSIDTEDLTVSRAVVSDASGKIAVSEITSNELGYLNDVTSNIQTQMDSKQNLSNDLKNIALLTHTDGNLIISDGSNWTTESGADARASLGLGSVATEQADNINITGGNITGVTDITVSDGGTGASDVNTARSNLGLEIGVDVQAYNANLADLADGTLSASKVEN